MSCPDSLVAEIKGAATGGMAIREIARRYSVSASTAWRIVRGHRGADVAPAEVDPTALDLEALVVDARTLKARGMTCAEVASQLEVSERTVRRWLTDGC